MRTRRNYLISAAGTIAVSAVAGCLSGYGPENNDESESDDGRSPENEELADDELLNSLSDPSNQVIPRYFSGYQYDIGDLIERFEYQKTIPRLGGSVAELFDGQVDGIEFSDLEQITGSVYSSWSSGGALNVQPGPSGQTVHATGSFTTEPFRELLENSDRQTRLGESEEYERYVAETLGGDGFETWAVKDGRLIIVSRSDVTSQQEDGTETAASEALEPEFDQVEQNGIPVADASPAFVESVRQLDSGPIRAGAGYALIPQDSDTGNQTFDDAIRGVVGAGLSARLNTDAFLQRSVSYLTTELASEDTVQNVYEQPDIDEMQSDSWEFSTNGRTITARVALDSTPNPAMLKTGLPVPGYQSLFTRVKPGELGRAPTPRVFFQPAVGENGSLQITHTTGGEVSNLRVRYLSDGEVKYESWDGVVSNGDTFTSEQTVDTGSLGWITWRPDTVDAAVLIRFEILS